MTPVVLFDGMCNLCTWGVRWIIRRDRRGVFVFASRDSAAARRILDSVQAPRPLPESMILIDERGMHSRSDAAIRIAMRLGFPWNMARVWLLVPRRWRDGAYACMARNRYRWFGKRGSCLIPTPELRDKFLDADEADRSDR